MKFKSTTIVGVRKGSEVAMAGDGQVTLHEVILKHTARKIRKLYDGRVLAGFAGSIADALTLFDKFETKLDRYKGQVERAVVELAKDWRTDKVLRRLEALLIVMDKNRTFIVSGNGEVLEPDEDVIAIGSGGGYALAAAKALMRYSNLSAREIAEEAIRIAASICVYTNDKIFVEELKDETK